MAEQEIKDAVRERYAGAARQVLEVRSTSGCCGAPVESTPGFGASVYEALEADEVPDAARLASLGCGNPTAVAELHPGETVLDLGSGGGLDVLLSARRVGPTGRVYGLDMTDEMLELARRNQAEAGITNVEFLKGEIEEIPLPDGSVDVIISNCVINLSADKSKVFAEAHRVLAPGGRFAVSDMVTLRPFTAEEKADLASWTGCVAGALTIDEYVAGLEAAGFHDASVQVTHEVGSDVASAIIRATA
ncbi:MAG: arsenite methyltransferase [Acidimicrobiia bacterium]|nr:arsenite methyltransferase [Acidimicrobiia bacterium]